jgi:anti-sigma regulatory factor (Ser/Thr protein kinase)/anti-anti-sigma regulatory factor
METLTWSRRDVETVTVLTVTGPLNATTSLIVRRALQKAQTDHPDAVVVDVSGLTATHDSPLLMFAAQARHAEAGGAPILLCGADRGLEQRLDAHPALRRLFRFKDVDSAVLAARSGRVLPERFRVRSGPTANVVAEARALVARACATWGVVEVSEDAELVVSELCSNAVRHARTPMQVLVRRTASHLYIEVFDGSPRMPVERTVDVLADSGRGLFIIGRFTSAWGSNRVGAGKVVWAALRLPTRGKRRGAARRSTNAGTRAG